MASPQIEDGYTPIAHEIVEHLWKINLSAYENRVLWYLFRKTYGWKKKTDWITLSQFSRDIGLDRRLIHRAIHALSSKKMIVIYKDDRGNVSYGFQKDYEKWQVSSKKMTVIYKDDGVSSKEMMRLSSKKIPTKETITKETITKERYATFFEIFWTNYPARNGKKVNKPGTFKLYCQLNEEELPLCNQAAKHYADSERVRDGIGIKDPERFILSGRGKDKIEYWREWIEPEIQTPGGANGRRTEQTYSDGQEYPCDLVVTE